MTFKYALLDTLYEREPKLLHRKYVFPFSVVEKFNAPFSFSDIVKSAASDLLVATCK